MKDDLPSVIYMTCVILGAVATMHFLRALLRVLF
jgi:hypothetical protein